MTNISDLFTVAICLSCFGAWIFIIVFVLAMCKAAAMGDRQMGIK